VNRSQWQQLAERYLVDAKTLLDNHRWSAAYYVAGYAVESGLKACVLVRLAATPEVIFKIKRFSESCWTHNLAELMGLADLEPARAADAAANPAFSDNWMIAQDWNEMSRYQTTTHHLAKKLYNAIVNTSNGVMPWIRVRW